MRFYVVNYEKAYCEEESVEEKKAFFGRRNATGFRFTERKRFVPRHFVKIDKYYTQTADFFVCRER